MFGLEDELQERIHKLEKENKHLRDGIGHICGALGEFGYGDGIQTALDKIKFYVDEIELRTAESVVGQLRGLLTTAEREVDFLKRRGEEKK